MAAPTVQKAVDFFREQEYNFDVTVGETTGWRTVAKLAVRKQAGTLRIGLFVPGSHELLEVPQCQAHHPRINSAVDVLQTKCRKLGIQPFEENSTDGKGGCLRHVAINVQRSTGKQQITLVWKEHDDDESSSSKAKGTDKLKLLCDTLIRVSENNDERLSLHSLWIHYNNSWKHANSIFARDGRWEKLHGEDRLIEHLDIADDHNLSNVPLQFPPQVFRQANLDAFTKIIDKIRSWLKDQSARKLNCLELYGGVGTIGLHLVDRLESLTSSDENPFNKDCFETTVSALQFQKPKCKCSISYESKNAADMVLTQNTLDDVDLVIVDPPRKGLDEEVVQALCRRTNGGEGPSRLIYVSCGFDAFRRDFSNLTVTGQWKLDHAEGHVLFPGSDAIETLVFFTRE
jgi:tRNA/tmRNA/rRNA uracil-C5-methylase (TrmA/RlmC/RlmD family)